MTSFNLPDLGEGLGEAEIVQWHVSPGVHVVRDQPLVSVETDKAVVEIPAPFSGNISKLLANEGEVVRTGEPIVEIEAEKTEDAGAIVGDIAVDNSAPMPESGKPTVAKPALVKATPAVRKYAAERGIDLSQIAGSGPEGAILNSDLPSAAGDMVDGDELRGVRLAMASAMTASHASVVPATLTDHAIIQSWSEDEMPMLRLVHAVAAAAVAEPTLNAWFDGKRLKRHSQVDLAIAVDTPEGLFAPVLKNAADTRNFQQRFTALREAVLNRTIAHQDLKGGTITLSNFGMLGGAHAALVVMPPQVAILGAGRIDEACIAENGKPVVRKILPLSLTFDHRVVTGGEAARFMAAARRDLERARLDVGSLA